MILAVAVVVGVAYFSVIRRQAEIKAKRIACVSRLKNVGLSVRLWSGDHGDKYPAQVSVTNGGVMELVNAGSIFTYFNVMSNELSTPILVACPADAQRKQARRFSSLAVSNVSYFVGLDASEVQPQGLLAGDRNLATNGIPLTPGITTLFTNTPVNWTADLHAHQGNVALSDGSVQQLNNSNLVEAVRWSGPSIPGPGVTNWFFRLAIP